MSLTIAGLLASPDHYLHRFDGDRAVFVPMDRAAYHRSIFLDGRIVPAAPQEMRVPVAMLGDAPAPPSTAWIFHVAHCGSTLLARGLDDPAGGLVLREPQALRQAALAGDAERLRLAAAIAGRRYRVDAPTLVKANVPVNFALPELVQGDPGARAILLYASLRDYLLAILRSDNHRAWLRRVTDDLAGNLGEVSGRSDAYRAAVLWRAQMERFAATARTLPGARSLDAEHFFAAPAATLRAAARHLGLPIETATLEATATGPLFATYSKNPEVAFDNAARLDRRATLEPLLAAEIAEAEAAVGDVAAMATVRAAALA
jgi:hypothetical protein